MQMHRGKSIERREHMITTNSSSSDDDNNVSLIIDQEKAPDAHVLTHDASFSSAMPQRRGGVLSQHDPFTHKYKAQWKVDL
jgi:hypothetical protein